MGVQRLWNKPDVTAMLRLVRRLHEVRPAAAHRRRTLLDGLRELARGAAAIGVAREHRPAADHDRRDPTGDGEDHTGGIAKPVLLGLDADDVRPLVTAVTDGELHDPALEKLLRRARGRASGTTVTLTRRDLVADDRWYASPHVTTVRRPAGLDDAIYSAHVLAPGRAAVVCVWRAWGDRRPFGPRDRHLVDLLHHESAWVYRDAAPRAAVDALPLSPREKQTLWNLLAGRGEKQIATQMGLSVNTVHHYVKALYRHFDVSSRAELLARWMERGG
jgi:DNA-binding CsgD family transcriptional regulator